MFDAALVPGNASLRRKGTLVERFSALGFGERFVLVSIPDSNHVVLECKECRHVFTRYASFLNKSKNGNVECNNCGIRADGTRGNPRSDVKRKSFDEGEVIEYYLAGNSANQTARKFGVNLRRVRRIIDGAGVSRDRDAAVQVDDYPTEITGDPLMDEALTCVECGREFTRHQHALLTGAASGERMRDRRGIPPKYCSPKCSNRVHGRLSKYSRRKAEASAKQDVIPLGDLVERDGGVCQICGEAVDAGDGWFDSNGQFHVGRLYPTMDHVVPISKGGKTTWDNVQLAHLACNSGKRDRITLSA